MIDRFTSYLRSLNMSENTIVSYGRDVREFLRFVESRGTQAHEVDERRLLEFLEHLTGKGLKSSARVTRLFAIPRPPFGIRPVPVSSRQFPLFPV